MTIQIRSLNAADAPRWDAFVQQRPESTFFHLSGWKSVLERTFNHSCHFLYAEDGGEIVGILPLAQVKSLLFGNNLASLPFCVYGGIVANHDAAHTALRNSACKLADELRVDSLEMRNLNQREEDWPGKNLYVTFRKEIPEDPEQVLKFIPNKQRAVVRKGIKAGLQGDGEWDARRIYNVYSESVRDLGTPVFTAKYFHVLREVFGDQCRSLMITHEGRDVAGVLSFYFRDQVLPYYAGSTEAARPLYAHGFMYWELMRRSSEEGIRLYYYGGSTSEARNIKGVNHFMYWDLMRRAAARGYRVCDFGRSKVDTGSYSFKKNWGFEPEPLNYDYYLVKSDAIPEVNPTNPKYQLFIEAWKKLPLAVANFLGPFLARSLG